MITTSTKPMTPAQFLDDALTHITGPATRKWAGTGHNRKVFIKLAATAMGRGMNPVSFAGYILAQSMG